MKFTHKTPSFTITRCVWLAALGGMVLCAAVWQGWGFTFGLAFQQPPVISVRTLVTTIAGGGFSAIAPPKEAPLVSPAMTTRDPQGRGFYVVDEVGGTSLLKFVNTSNAAVTLAGVTIPAGQIGLVAGGGAAPDNGSAREVDLSLITGITVDPNGSALYFTTPLVNAVRAVNVGTQTLQMFGQTIAAGNVGNLFLISRPDLRALAVHPVTRDFYYVSTLSDSSTIKVVYRRDAASGQEAVYAGGGEPAIGNGDEGPATNARVVTPIGLAFDRNNLLLIAEGGDARRNPGAIRRVESGLITSLIKNLDFPTGVSVAANGDVYVAIGNKQQIGRVSTTGALTIVAGNNSATACNATGTGTCGDGGAALSALLNLPGSTDQRTFDFAVDANGVIIPGLATRRIRYASFSNSTITVAGTTIEPRQINGIAGNGQEEPYDNIPATSSELHLPTGIVTDANGNLFITDSAPDPVSRLRFLNRGATPVTLFGNTPWAKTVQPGHIVTLNDQVGEALADDRITTANFQWPQGMYATTKGLYIIDSQYGALIKPQGSLSGRRSGHLRFLNTSTTDVVLFPAGGNFKITVAPGEIKDIAGVNQVNPNSNYGLNGNIGDGGPSVGAVLFPTDVVVSPGGSIFIADQGSNRIRVIDSFTGIIRSVETATISGDRLPLTTNGATGLAFDSRGRLVIADTKQNQILRQPTPNSTTFVAIANATLGINRPRDVVIDSNDNIFISNSGAHQVLRLIAPNDALGTVTTVAGSFRGFAGDGGAGLRAKFDLPNPTSTLDVQLTVSLAFALTGELLVTDGNNNRVRMLTPVPNQPPVITAPPDTTLNENETRTLNLSVTDGNNDPLSISITNRPPFVTFTETGNGTGQFNLAPTFTDAGTYTITVSTNDGDATVTKDFRITVNDVNRPPTASAQAIAATLEANTATGRQITLSGAGSDPDGDTLTFKWFDGAALIAQTASPTVTLGFGNHSLMLTVTDSKGMSATTTSQTTLVQDTTAPVFATIPADIAVTSATPTVVFFAPPTANDAVDGNVTVTAQPPSGSTFAVGTTPVTFTAKDSRNNTATATFRVVVSSTGGGGGGGGGNGGGGGGGTTASSFAITTFAGNGSYSFSGDGGAATDASFREIRAIHRDKDGNFYVVDGASRNIRRINTQGQIRGFAGNGINGNDGDSRQATTANFNTPAAVTSDAQGNVYIADSFYNRVRRVTTDGRIAHFAGLSAGTGGYGGDGGAAALARLNRPSGLAVFGNYLYLADTGNNRIRRVNLDTNVIETYAGDGITGPNGDGGLATVANLNTPIGLAFDAAGNLFIADRNNHRIRRVDVVTRTIISVAGTGQPGFTNDDATATSAKLSSPNDVAVDALGNLYIADQANHRIRRVTTNGIIKTIAGTGSLGFNGDSNLATTAQLNAPAGLAIDPQGNIFIADAGNLRIRRLTPSTATQNRSPIFATTLGNQTLVVGQILELPLSATDADSDNVTFTLVNAPSFATITNANPAQRNATLRLAPTETGTFNNMQVQASDGKGGTASSTSFNITVNEATGTNRPPTANANTLASPVEATSSAGATISLVGQGSDPDGDALTFTWFNGAASLAAGASASATLPIGTHSIKLTVSDGRGGIAMTAPQPVVVRDTTPPVFSNVPANIATTATSATGATVNFSLPTATDAVDGAIAVNASRASGSVFPLGVTTITFTAIDSRNNESTASFTITVTSGNTGGGTTPASYNISTHAGTGEFGFFGDGGAALNASFRHFTSFNRDKDGNLLIADHASRVVRRIAADGSIRTIAGNGSNGNAGDNALGTYASFGAVSGVAADALGNLYVSDSANHRVRRIGTDGKITHFAGSSAGQSGATGDQSPPASARLNRPTALAVDAQNNLYILDSGNSRIRRVDIATNTITTYAGSGVNGFSGDGNSAPGASLSYPSSIALDAQGNLFIADRSNHRIRRVDGVTKNISTVAGNGTQGFGGDDGDAMNAALNNPTDIAVDAVGNLYLVDQGNHRIRRIRASNRVIETIAGTGLQSFGGDNGPATKALLSAPTAVNVAADGSAFIGDTGNLRIRKLTPASGASANRNPVISTALGNQSIINNQVVEIALAATDEDGDAVTFTLLNAPSFATITNANPAQRSATLRLAPTQTGTFSGVRVNATDGQNGAATSAAFDVIVTETSGGNHPPVIQVIADQTVTRGQAIDVEVRATDPDNDPVTFTLDNAPGFVTLAQANPTARSVLLRIAPPLEGSDATFNFSIIANDGRGGTATSNTFAVNLRNGGGGGGNNLPPTAIANVLPAEFIADTQGAAALRLDGTASSDPDGDALSYNWLDRGVTIATTAIAEIRLPVGEHLISLRVSDNRGGSNTSVSQTVKVFERPVLPALGIQSITPATAKRGTTVNVTIIGTGFQPGAQVQIGGGGVTETVSYVNANTLSVRLSIAPNAFSTTRTIYVTNPDSTYAVKPNAFVINP